MIAYAAAFTIALVDAPAAHELLNLAEEASRHAYERDAADWTERLDARASELRPAVETLVAAGDHLAALRLVAALRVYAQDSGRADVVRSLADHVLS
ncbi:MAG: hypothetical protein ICV64_00935, partial [Thermoleophilia bacterium]|nr:hypothetical protein [Thermoleophilia bacterium]